MIKQLYTIFVKGSKSKKMITKSKPVQFLIYLGIFLLFAGITSSVIYSLVAVFLDSKLLSSLPFDLGNITLLIGMFINFIVVFISTFSFIFSSCYLDKNLDNYITLPIKTRDFTIAKLLYVYRNALLISIIVIFPTLNISLFLGNINFLDIVMLLVYTITLPVILIYIQTFIIVTLLYFINKMKNKRTAKQVLLSVVLIFFLFIYLYFLFYLGYNPTNLISTLFKLKEVLGIIFFYPLWVIRVFVNKEMIYLLYMLIAVVACIFVQFYFEKLYFKSSIGFNSDDYKLKKTSTKNDKKYKNVFRWFNIIERNDIFKTPVYFYNTILGNILTLVIILVAMAISFFNKTPDQINETTTIIKSIDMYNMLLIVFIIATVASFLNMGPATIFSRGSNNFSYVKTLPVSYTKALLGKLFFHLLVDIITTSILIIVPFIYFKINILTIILSLLIVILVATATIFIPICVDLFWPSLDSDSQTAVVKRSKSVPISLLIHFIFISIVLFAGVFLYFSEILNASQLLIVSTLFYLILILLFYKLFVKLTIRAYKKY